MAFWTLYKREFSSYFQSAVAYVVLFGSALIQGIVFWLFLTNVVDQGFKDASVLQLYFNGVFFWLMILIQVPLITMRVFSEEFKLGTIEMLLTAPVGEWDVVLAKFFGALTFFVVLWSPVALDLLALQLFSVPPPPVYWSQIGMLAVMIVLVGGFYVSIGVFTSVLTRNQIVAAILCFAALFGAFSFSILRYIQHVNATLLSWVSYVSAPEHIQNAGLGIFDTRPLVFYVTITAFILLVTKSVLESRRLRG